jgi:hypothetical protein
LRLSALLSLTVVILLTLAGGAHAHCVPFIGWCYGHHPDPRSVPEIDPGLAASGVMLLTASILVLLDRRSA